MASRALYLTFYILYLMTLAVGIWFLLYYSGVPSWVWTFFAIAILIAIISAVLKEHLLTRTITTSGIDITDSSHSFWLIFYILMNFAALILIVVGIIFVIRYSTIPWWVWFILGAAIFFSIISNIMLALGPIGILFAVLVSLFAFVLFITGIILLIAYSNAPWWVWLIIGLAILFSMLASIFEGIGDRNEIIVVQTCGIDGTNCPLPVQSIQPVQPVVAIQPPQVINVSPPQQYIYV